MENSLHALILWIVIWQSLEFLLHIQEGEFPNFWGLTLALTLNVWTRLDSALLSVVLFLSCIILLIISLQNNLQLFIHKYAKVIAGSIALASAGFIMQLAAFQLMGDSILPVSALIKTTTADAGTSTSNNLVQIFTLGMPAILQGRFSNLVLVVIGISSIAAVLFMASTTRDRGGLQALWRLWTFLLLGELIYYVYVALSGIEYRPYFIWYRSPSFIFWIITAVLIAYFTFLQVSHRKLSPTIQRWSLIGASFVICMVAVYMFARSINFTSKLYVARYEAALWIAENSAPETIFAAWNAGQLGYFSNRTFINLDGLINGIDYYERVLSGSLPLTEYLFENKVAYIVDYNIYASIPEFPVVRSFPINDGSGESIQIWQIFP